MWRIGRDFQGLRAELGPTRRCMASTSSSPDIDHKNLHAPRPV